MEAAWEPAEPARGAELLLEHGAALARLDGQRPPAADRLRRALGGELAGLLLRALAGGQRGRSRELVG